MSRTVRDATATLDFDAFTRAVVEMNLGEGVDAATCHFSAVSVKDWSRIQGELARISAEGEDGGSDPPR